MRSFILAKRRQGIPLPQNSVYRFLSAERPLDWKTTCLLAEALGESPDVVRPMWRRARRAIDAKEPCPDTAIHTWDDLPPPDAKLRELFVSQLTPVDRFPYDLLEVKRPPLATVYVELGLQPVASGAKPETVLEKRPGARENQGDVIPFRRALSQHTHLFVTGGPGTGKTILGRLLIQQIAREWLADPSAESPWCDEPVIGLRVTAGDVLSGLSWGEVLAKSACEGMLTVPFDPQAFSRKTFGVRWLVVVDGLDELASPRERKRVLTALGKRADHGTPYRLVITSRPLPQDELGPLENFEIGFYSLCGLDDVQQLSFAERWFQAQREPDPSKTASLFLQEARIAGLSELMRIPLLATIVASFFSREPSKSLPTGRIELYERFLQELADARRQRKDIRARLRSRWEEVGCVAAVDRIFSAEDDVVLHLAQVEISSNTDRPLLAAAVEWAGKHLPENGGLRAGMERDLGHVLGETSILVFDGKLAFLHRSFAEFIAARHVADSIPREFPDLEGWVKRVEFDATRNFAFFVLAQWARKPENKVATVVRFLLTHGLKHKIMALRLVTAGVPLGAELENAVIDRLVNDLLAQLVAKAHAERLKLLAELSELHGNRNLCARLRDVADCPELSTTLRIAAAAAYAYVGSLPAAVRHLRSLIGTDDPDELSDLYLYMTSLDASATELRIELLLRVRQLGDPWKKVWATSELLELGIRDGATDLAEQVLSGPDQNGDLLDWVGDIWLQLEGETATPRIQQAVRRRKNTTDWAHVGIAQLLFRAGEPEHAEPHARQVLLAGSDEEGMQGVVEAWVEACDRAGAAAVAEVMSSQPVRDFDERSKIAKLLHELGYPEEAVRLARTMFEVTPRKYQRFALAEAMEVLARVQGVQATEEILAWLDRVQPETETLSYGMDSLRKHGLDQTVTAFARRIIATPASSVDEFTSAADALLSSDGPEVAVEIMTALDTRPTGRTVAAAMLAPIMARHACAQATTQLCRALIYDAGRTTAELQVAVESWTLVAGRDSVPEIIALAESLGGMSAGDRLQLAERLSDMGFVEDAVGLWCKACVEPSLSTGERIAAAERLLSAGSATIACATLRNALHNAGDPEEVRRLRQLLAWVEAALSVPSEAE
ncbi:NACHT domain-containing protein [Nonomuraea gerenzanensis]|uniref:NACHT domain-containing protein n=1 Tax=Nonomuraea gerenzanensis TaxID=93944 RepID=UPI001CDA28F7|nr:hypothetical protein [Nonomuraea gerenzanensis]UBU17376.1 hypothetical protein LCN96_20830 [Nonomuraea gerenzanensis]